MPVRTYLVHLQDDAQDDEARADVAESISNIGGFILMALSTGALIVAFDECHLSLVKSHRHVEFCGGVTLDPRGQAANQLRKFFAQNIAAQMAGRGGAQGAQQQRAAPEYPPGYRPLSWHRRFE